MKNILNRLNTHFVKYILLVILIFAAVLRLWNLGNVPPGLTPDEASLGYNAYSIWKTGNDEYGNRFPLIFKSFGDYKPGLYIYLAVPSVAILGLNEFAVRLPSAIFGVLIVLFVYLIVKKLFAGSNLLALTASFVASCNPYLIYFSRGAWEANVSLALTLVGVYLFLIAIEKKKYLLPSTVFFALTLITYQGAKLSTLIVVSLLVIIYWKEFWSIKKECLIIGIIGGLIVSIPAIASLFNGHTQRLAIFSIFSYPRPQSEIQLFTGPLFNLYNSNQLNYLRMILSRLFNFFSGSFMFFYGDIANPVHTAPYQGILLITDIFWLLLGFYYIFRNKFSNSYAFVILLLILSPLSAAISRDQTNAVRCLNSAFPLIIIIALGVYQSVLIISKLSAKLIRIAGYLVIFVVYFLSFTYFADSYFVHLPKHNSSFWRYGYKQAVSLITPLQSEYKTIVFEQSFNQPYIYFLFYQKYDPAKWQKESNLVDSEYKGDVGYQERVGNVAFKKIDWQALKNIPGTLVVTSPSVLPPDYLNNAALISQIKYLDNHNVAFDIIKIK